MNEYPTVVHHYGPEVWRHGSPEWPGWYLVELDCNLFKVVEYDEDQFKLVNSNRPIDVSRIIRYLWIPDPREKRCSNCGRPEKQ